MISLLGLKYKLIDIAPIVNQYSQYIEPNEFSKGNLRARVRANILYYYANSKKYLVLGSSDKSEYLIGYFTKYGDGASDILPINSLYKLQIREIAKFLGVPQNIIEKKSSPHLWKSHEAEKELGITYEEIDSILYCIFDKNKIPLYIGKTKNNLLTRESQHRRKFKEEIFIFELDLVDDKEWRFWECYWIEQFKQWGFNLKNHFLIHLFQLKY
jgi:NAD+ synthetase